jgi:uncharacterized SAM-binding protein YcdF (DUF218 family)
MSRKSIAIAVVLSLFTVGSVWLFHNAGTWLIKNDAPTHADAIVMLMGSIPDRVLETSDQYNEGLATQIIIAEESMGAYRDLLKRGVQIISNTTQCSTALVKLGVLPENIICLPGDANSTQNEAVIIRKYLKTQPSIDTITLVSSPDHTRRASMIFEKAFKKQAMPVVVYSCPSKYSGFTGKGWWRDKEGIQTVLGEYVKMLNFYLFDQRKL